MLTQRIACDSSCSGMSSLVGTATESLDRADLILLMQSAGIVEKAAKRAHKRAKKLAAA